VKVTLRPKGRNAVASGSSAPPITNATKAAVEEGIVPGGCVALLRAAEALEHLR